MENYYDSFDDITKNNYKKLEDSDDCYVETVNAKLARAYVPYQRAERIFSPEDSLLKGTVFPELFQPFNE